VTKDEVRLWFHTSDPPELTRLVVGELPGPFEELCLGHWDAAIILRREVLCEKPRGVCRLVVRDGVVRERQGDDDLVFQNFHVKSAPRAVIASSVSHLAHHRW
jgi:hypothetical protein